MTDAERRYAKITLCVVWAHYGIVMCILMATLNLQADHRSRRPPTNSVACEFGLQTADASGFWLRDHEIKRSRCWEPI